MTLEQAIVSALDYEHKVRDHYANAATRTTDPSAKGIFSALAEEEQGHVDYLNSRLDIWRASGKLDIAKVKETLPPKEWLEQGKVKMRKIDLDRDYTDEIKMLKDALKLEEEVSAHYRKLVGFLTGDGQAMFKRFLEIEDGHTAIVRAEIDALQKDGFWFDISEFNLEAG